mmetsp:Transcript_20452/g.41921  ORF Transcript_20452/g.41921 Transcript_20452/m.41921 type:complete len:116 (+) Transcript_20452:835-1182(+)
MIVILFLFNFVALNFIVVLSLLQYTYSAGGQKINKTSNKVILVHIPTRIRVECQETRSLQQNRKIARKQMKLKLDDFFNGQNSRNNQKASVAAAKKAKTKARNARRQQQKKQKKE